LYNGGRVSANFGQSEFVYKFSEVQQTGFQDQAQDDGLEVSEMHGDHSMEGQNSEALKGGGEQSVQNKNDWGREEEAGQTDNQEREMRDRLQERDVGEGRVD
jgi:hypothetical protein